MTNFSVKATQFAVLVVLIVSILLGTLIYLHIKEPEKTAVTVLSNKGRQSPSYEIKILPSEGKAKLKICDGVYTSRGVYEFTYDSCEYVFVGLDNASWGSHKGNCKYCASRAALRDSALVKSITGR